MHSVDPLPSRAMGAVFSHHLRSPLYKLGNVKPLFNANIENRGENGVRFLYI